MLGQLIDAVRDRLNGKTRANGIAQEVASKREQWLARWQPKLRSDERPINPYRVISEFMRVVNPAEAIVTHNSGSPREQLNPFYRATRPRGYVGWGKSHLRIFDRLGDKFLPGKHDPADFALRLLHKDVGLAVGLRREVGVPMRLANLVCEELSEALNRGWGTRNSSVSQLLQVERAGIPPLAADPKRIAAVLDADKQK